MFWGKIKHKTLAELFGDLDQLASSLPLMPAAPPMPQVTREVSRLELDPIIHAEVGLPIIDFGPLLARLPAIAVRDWAPADQAARGQEVSYLALAGVDVIEPLDLVERLSDALQKGALPHA